MDPIDAWTETFTRVSDLALTLDGDQLATHVPATPDWTTRDLLSHMVGLAVDVVGGDEPDDHNPAWTQAQVEARSDHSAAELVAEWRSVSEALVAWMREHGSRPLNDAVIHEQDLRGALSTPGGRDTEALAIVRGRMVERFAGSVADLSAAAPGGLAPLALAGPGWTWCSAGDADEAGVRLEAPDFDLFRALTARRTAGQLQAWTVRGDVTPYLDAFAGLGPLPEDPLPE